MVAGADVTAGAIAKQISMAFNWPPAPDAAEVGAGAAEAAGDPDEGIGGRAPVDDADGGIGGRAAPGVPDDAGASGAGVAVGAASAAGSAAAALPGVATTKVSVTPGGRTTRWPVAIAVTAAGGARRPKPPKTDPTAFAAVDAALWAALVTLAELLVTAIACPPTVKEVS